MPSFAKHGNLKPSRSESIVHTPEEKTEQPDGRHLVGAGSGFQKPFGVFRDQFANADAEQEPGNAAHHFVEKPFADHADRHVPFPRTAYGKFLCRSDTQKMRNHKAPHLTSTGNTRNLFYAGIITDCFALNGGRYFFVNDPVISRFNVPARSN